MTYPASDVGTTNTDAGTDSPATARTDILDLMTKFNLLRNHISSFMQGVLNRATAALVRADLGSTAVGDAVFVAASTAAARTALASAASGANSDITSLSGLTTALSVAQGGTGTTTGNAPTATLATAATGIAAPVAGGGGIALAIGQTAYIDVAASTSVALGINTADNQLYEIICAMQGNTGSGANATLNPNNTTYTNFFKADASVQVGSSVSANASYQNAFLLAYGMDPRMIVALASTKTASKWVTSKAEGYTTGSQSYQNYINTEWNATASTSTVGDTATAWTSLGTVVFPVAATGRILVRRVA